MRIKTEGACRKFRWGGRPVEIVIRRSAMSPKSVAHRTTQRQDRQLTAGRAFGNAPARRSSSKAVRSAGPLEPSLFGRRVAGIAIVRHLGTLAAVCVDLRVLGQSHRGRSDYQNEGERD